MHNEDNRNAAKGGVNSCGGRSQTEPQQDDENWLTDVDAAFRMSQSGNPISWRTISKWRDSDRIPCQECNGLRLVRISDVTAFSASQQRIDQQDAGSCGNGSMPTEALLKFDEL
jgi:hypothetical protein